MGPMAELSSSAVRQRHRQRRNQWLLTAPAETHPSMARLDAFVRACAPEHLLSLTSDRLCQQSA
jgi:hypothetical protein